MNIKVYSQFNERNKENNEISCYLCETTLKEYVESIPDDFENYGIQREIVNNIYLDKLVDTVLKKRYIPSISLVVKGRLDGKSSIESSELKILDGLQRTYRLKVIYKTYKLLLKNILNGKDYRSSTKRMLSREIGEELVEIDSSIQLSYEIKNNLYHE